MSTQIQTPQIKITQKAEINEIFQDVYDARTQQRFFKQFRITKHGMAFLIKHRNEFEV
jgi:hypothetical protein